MRKNKDITINWIGFPVLLQNVKTKIILNEECIDMDPSLIEGRIYRFLLGVKVWSEREAHFVRMYKQMTKENFEVFLRQLNTTIDAQLGDREITVKFCDGF